MLLGPYQGFKEMIAPEIMTNLNTTEKELEKYSVVSVYKGFQNINVVKRILMTLDVNQSFMTKNSTTRRKRRQNFQNMH